MKEIEILSHIWLPKKASVIYVDLLKNWDASISEASKRTWIHRPIIYKMIPYLEELWLVSQRIIWKRKVFSAESPENLRNIFENTRNNFDWLVTRFNWIFDEKKIEKATLKTIEWENFSKNVFDDIGYTLWKDEMYYRYSSVTSLAGQEKYANYKKLRDKKNIQRMIITSDYLSKTKPYAHSHEVVHIPKNYDLFDDNVTKVIYKNKVSIIDHSNKVSFIIEDAKLAGFEKKIFKLLFRSLKRDWNYSQ